VVHGKLRIEVVDLLGTGRVMGAAPVGDGSERIRSDRARSATSPIATAAVAGCVRRNVAFVIVVTGASLLGSSGWNLQVYTGDAGAFRGDPVGGIDTVPWHPRGRIDRSHGRTSGGVDAP